MKRKKKDYTPYPGFYDLRIFDLSHREFLAAWRVQEFLHRAAGRKRYYKTYAPRQWEELKELGALLQMFLLPRLKPNEELRYRKENRIMIRTDADNQFDLMEEAAREVLGVMGEQKDNTYPGKLLTQLAPVEGKADDMFLPPLKVGEVHTIESILKTGNYGYAYFYKKSNEPPAVFLMTMTPENIANYLGAHQYDCYKMILSDKFDVQILDTIGGFINHCTDRELCQKILPHLVPIQQCKKRPEPVLLATYDAFDAYNYFVDMLSEGTTVEQLKEAARAAGHEV